MPDINIQQATEGRWRRSTKLKWVFVLLLAAVLGWGAIEMVGSARDAEHPEGPPSPAAGPVTEEQPPPGPAAEPVPPPQRD